MTLERVVSTNVGTNVSTFSQQAPGDYLVVKVDLVTNFNKIETATLSCGRCFCKRKDR